MATKSLRNLHFALLTKDDSTGVAYGEMKQLAKMIKVDVNNASASTELYGDDGVVAVDTSAGVTTVTLEMSDISLTNQGILLGHTVTKGVMERATTDEAPVFGIAFEGRDQDGKKVFKKFLKGKALEMDSTMETRVGTPKFNTPTMVMKFMAREFDNKIDRVAREAEPEYEATTGANWYTTFEPTV